MFQSPIQSTNKLFSFMWITSAYKKGKLFTIIFPCLICPFMLNTTHTAIITIG